MEAIQNQTIHLSCEATGDPTPRITWFKRDVELFPMHGGGFGGRTMQHHGGISGSPRNVIPLQGDQVLQLTNVQKGDAGDYAGMASNGGDAIEKKFNLTVIRKSIFASYFISYNVFLNNNASNYVEFRLMEHGDRGGRLCWSNTVTM